MHVRARKAAIIMRAEMIMSRGHSWLEPEHGERADAHRRLQCNLPPCRRMRMCRIK